MCIFLAAFFYTIGSILMIANFGSLAELLAGRVLSGIGSGFGMTTGAVYISEAAPNALRGCMSTFYNINIMGGVAGAYWINYACLRVIPASSHWQWRVPMILQLIPAVALFAGFLFCPESPRYLALKGRMDQAKSVLMDIRGLSEDHPFFVAEYNELRAKVDKDSEAEGGWKAFKTLFAHCAKDPSTRKRFIFVFIIQTLFIMSGGNSITVSSFTVDFCPHYQTDNVPSTMLQPFSNPWASTPNRSYCLQQSTVSSRLLLSSCMPWFLQTDLAVVHCS